MTSINKRLYKIAGVTQDAKGVIKVRYSGEEYATRIKMYMAQDCPVVDFIELPREMNKIDVCKYMLGDSLCYSENPAYKEAIELEMAKKEQLVAPKVAKKRGRPLGSKSAKAVAVAVKLPVLKPAKKAVKAAVKPAKKAAPLGEVPTLEVTEDSLDSDFNLDEFKKLAEAMN